MRTEDLAIAFFCCLISSLCSATLATGIILTATVHKHNAWPVLIVVPFVVLIIMFAGWLVQIGDSMQQNRTSK